MKRVDGKGSWKGGIARVEVTLEKNILRERNQSLEYGKNTEIRMDKKGNLLKRKVNIKILSEYENNETMILDICNCSTQKHE